MNAKDREDSLTLEILQTIDSQNDVTQRHLANRLGVALGLANSYLKRCVRKGLIKIEQAPANRYLYYLTPQGFAEKSRLTAEYLSYSFDFYRRASASCKRVVQECHEQSLQRILLCGLTELAEIAVLRAREQDMTVIGFLQKGRATDNYLGLPVWDSYQQVADHDACIITDLNAPSESSAEVCTRLSVERIFIPDILGLKKADLCAERTNHGG